MIMLQRLLRKLDREQNAPARADIVLGLPLEVEDRTIYPVYRESGSSPFDDDAEPRQIGYLEIGEGRADYTSLEPDYRWPVALAGLAIVSLVAAWTLRGFRR